MPLQKELGDLWSDITGTLIEFFFREIGSGMGHSQEFEAGNSPGHDHCPSRLVKQISND
jgi:hypothetical protein